MNKKKPSKSELMSKLLKAPDSTLKNMIIQEMPVEERIVFLKLQENMFAKKDKKLKKLRDSLLEIGGDVVYFTSTAAKEAKGFSKWTINAPKSKDIQIVKGAPASMCHHVSRVIYKDNKKHLSIYFGYSAKKERGLMVWYPHSWLVENKTGVVIEPTPIKRKFYYGRKVPQ